MNHQTITTSHHSLLRLTRLRDEVIFFSYALLILALFQLGNYRFMPWGLNRISLTIIMFGQFYLTAFIVFPIRRYYFRKLLYLLYHLINFTVFFVVVRALTPTYILADRWFDIQFVIFFLLILLGRDIKLYARLRSQLSKLDQWTQKKVLFEKPEKVDVHLGEAGMQKVHPNEIVYVRTKSPGDHTKIFGIKSKSTGRFREYETTAYANFEEIGEVLRQFPQFKRISQSTVINFKYPYEKRKGVIVLQGRRFSMSSRYA